MFNKLVLASNNRGKLAEIRAALGLLGLTLLPIGDFTTAEPVEDGGSFVANALIKARAAVAATGLPSLADDSGLVVPALAGKPGVDTHPFVDSCGGYDAAMKALLDEAQTSSTPITASCVLALVMPDGAEHLFEGHMHGTLVYPARGTAGFGFDKYVIPDGYTESLSQLGMEVKNRISHRAAALQKLVAHLQEFVSEI